MPYYPIATEEQARAGVDDTVMMTPLKVAMACEEFWWLWRCGGNVNVATLKVALLVEIMHMVRQ